MVCLYLLIVDPVSVLRERKLLDLARATYLHSHLFYLFIIFQASPALTTITLFIADEDLRHQMTYKGTDVNIEDDAKEQKEK